jgi:hypothetical protein
LHPLVGVLETVMAAKAAKPKTRGGIDRSKWATAGELADRVSGYADVQAAATGDLDGSLANLQSARY